MEVDLTSPGDHMPEISALCSLGMRPHLMTGILRKFLIQHFIDRNNQEQPAFRQEGTAPPNDYLWRASDSTGILIESITRWKPNTVEKRPAIILKRNAWTVERRGINDLMQGIPAIDALDRYATYMVGSHTLFCIAGEAAEVELLVAEVYRWLISFGPIIRQYIDLHRFVTVSVDSVFILDDEATENFVCPITVAYAHEERWTIRPHVPLLKLIEWRASELLP
jgi:hypothetical protein